MLRVLLRFLAALNGIPVVLRRLPGLVLIFQLLSVLVARFQCCYRLDLVLLRVRFSGIFEKSAQIRVYLFVLNFRRFLVCVLDGVANGVCSKTIEHIGVDSFLDKHADERT